MGFNNPNMPWWELEATLSDHRAQTVSATVALLVLRRGTQVAMVRHGAANASRISHPPNPIRPAR